MEGKYPTHLEQTNTTHASTDAPPSPRQRRLWGILHTYMRAFSQWYCGWVGIPYDNQIAQLPFGLILKWSDGTRMEEVLAMQVARAAGFPLPRVICYGEHPDTLYAPVSILMTREPGKELGQVYETLSNEDQKSVLQELKGYLEVMRGWSNLWAGNRICSLLGTAIRSIRVPSHFAGPFESEEEFNEYLIRPSWSGGFSSDAAYNDAPGLAKDMEKMAHRTVFTHGDGKPHNFLVDGGRITGFLDWESAGWYPEYWDFTTALRFTREDFWWYNFVIALGGNAYLELDCECTLTSLTPITGDAALARFPKFSWDLTLLVLVFSAHGLQAECIGTQTNTTISNNIRILVARVWVDLRTCRLKFY